MLLYIIRHGDPHYPTDSLTERGILQAEAGGKRLAAAGIDKVEGLAVPLDRPDKPVARHAALVVDDILLQGIKKRDRTEDQSGQDKQKYGQGHVEFPTAPVYVPGTVRHDFPSGAVRAIPQRVFVQPSSSMTWAMRRACRSLPEKELESQVSRMRLASSMPRVRPPRQRMFASLCSRDMAAE